MLSLPDQLCIEVLGGAWTAHHDMHRYNLSAVSHMLSNISGRTGICTSPEAQSLQPCEAAAEIVKCHQAGQN